MKKSLLTVCMVLFGTSAMSVAMANSFLADRHARRQVSCVACHEVAAPQPGAKVDNAKCLTCHKSADEVAKRTQKMDPNPHYNHLVGLRCQECHRGHQKSVNMCASCHNLQWQVP